MPTNQPGRHRREIFPNAVWASRRLHCLLCAWLLVAAAVLCAAPADAHAAAPSATIDTCFAPESDCAAFAVHAIDHAEREILVGAYGLTTGAGIVEALLRAHHRGVEVKLIADKTTPCGRNSGIDPLASAGVPVWIDHSARVAHAKTMVIDGAVTLSGSYNWTRGAAANSEDLNLVASPAVANAYAAHWRDRQGLSMRFDRREDWCRAGAR
jgi:phosphatidylserine/phosphatidylglycerophosphate/cardiolipin synthase-like enzyme